MAAEALNTPINGGVNETEPAFNRTQPGVRLLYCWSRAAHSLAGNCIDGAFLKDFESASESVSSCNQRLTNRTKLMKKRYLVSLAGCALAVTGCLVTSVYPFYTAKDVVFEPALTGSWTNASDAEERWEFAANTNNYRVTYMTKNATNVMPATLFKLHDNLFLDLFSPEMNDEVQPPPIPSHFLFRMTQIKPTVKMAPMNYEWLTGLLAENPKALRHHLIGDEKDKDKQRLVLTADTTDLQAFIVKHLGTAEAWKDPAELVRESGGKTTAK